MSCCQEAQQGRTVTAGTAQLVKSLLLLLNIPQLTQQSRWRQRKWSNPRPAPGGCLAEEGQSWDPPAMSLNTFYDKEDITAAKSIGPVLHKHNEADGLCLKPLLPDLPALGSQ